MEDVTLSSAIGIIVIAVPFVLAVFVKPVFYVISGSYRKLAEAVMASDNESIAVSSLWHYRDQNGEIQIRALRQLPVILLETQNKPRRVGGTIGDLITIPHFLNMKLKRQLRNLEHAALIVLLVAVGSLLVFVSGVDSLQFNIKLFDAFGRWVMKNHLIPIGELLAISYIVVLIKGELSDLDELLEKLRS